MSEESLQKELDRMYKRIEVLVEQNKLLRHSMDAQMKGNLERMGAHQKLMFRLYALTQSDEDPEMNRDSLDAALRRFFTDTGRPDISDLMDCIKTY